MRGHAHRGQRDANEPDIVLALEQVGATVVRMDDPCDLLVGFRGRNYLFEVKLPPGPRGGQSHSELTQAQVVFVAWWRGDVPRVVRTPGQALIEIGAASPVAGEEKA